MMDEEEEHFWLGQELESGKVLEEGVPPPDVQIKEVGQQVMWGPEPIVAQEGPPLMPLMAIP